MLGGERGAGGLLHGHPAVSLGSGQTRLPQWHSGSFLYSFFFMLSFFFVISFLYVALCSLTCFSTKKTTLNAIEVAVFPNLISVCLCVCVYVTLSLFSLV